jgi:hypothetical protein
LIFDCTIVDVTPRPEYPQHFDPFAGRVVPLVRYRTVDAAGRQVLMCQWCDTETGEVRRADYDPATGRFGIDPATGRVRVVREFRPAPLAHRMLAPGEPYLLEPPP